LLGHHSFSFAVQATPARHLGAWGEVARQAQALGYRALLVPDHVGSGGPFAAMAYAGAVTTSLRIGVMMLGVDFRNAAVMADELGTLRALISGRDEIGLGAGWLREDYELANLPMAPAGERINRLRVAAEQFLKQQQLVGNAGTQLVMGGGGDRMLGLAADLADVVNLSASMHAGVKDAPLGEGASFERFVRQANLVRGSKRTRVEAAELQCLSYITEVVEDTCDLADRSAAGFGLSVEAFLRSPLTLVGTVDEICRKLQLCRDLIGITYWVIKSSAMQDFAPVVARLGGR